MFVEIVDKYEKLFVPKLKILRHVLRNIKTNNIFLYYI